MSLPAAFLSAAARLIPKERRFDDPLSTLAFGTDASFYRLVPQGGDTRSGSEAEVRWRELAQAWPPPQRVPVTFRAAGTSPVRAKRFQRFRADRCLGNGWTQAVVERRGQAHRSVCSPA